MNEIEIGKCECCGADNVPLERTYFYYPFKCECCSPQHFVMIRHCRNCEPKEPTETKVTLKTDDLKNSFHFALKVMLDAMKRRLRSGIGG